jgi:hypothetical protein
VFSRRFSVTALPSLLTSSLPLKLTCMSIVPSKLSLGSLPYTNSLHSIRTSEHPNLISIFRRLGRLSKESVQVRGFFRIFLRKLFFYGEGLSALRPTPKLEDHPLSFVRGSLFSIFAAILRSWRPFLHPQLEDAPCCGVRDPPNMASKRLHSVISPNSVFFKRK